MKTVNTTISTSSRAFNYGDGCFTTISVVASVAQLLQMHIARLKDDCRRLGIGYSDWHTLEQNIADLANRIHDQNKVIKVLISRGDGGRGYSPQGCALPIAYLTEHAFPEHYAGWSKTGIRLGLAELKLARQPLLAGIKHLNRLEQVLIKQQLTVTEVDDLIVLDSEQHVIETSASNIFWYCKKLGWCTPCLDNAGVSGVMRGSVIAYIRAQGVRPVCIKSFKLDDLVRAEHIFICNSLMKIVPVRSLIISNSEYQKSIDGVALLQEGYSTWLETE